jgi:hypothetical protein
VRILRTMVGGLMMAFGAFMLLGFVAAWKRGSFHYSLGIQLAVLFGSVLMPFLVGFLLLKKSSTPRIDTRFGSHSIVTAESDPRNDGERGQSAAPGGASLAHSSSSLSSAGTQMKIRFSLTRFDLFKARTATLMFDRPLQIVLLLIAAFSGVSGFTAEAVAGKSVGYRVFYAGIETLFVIGFGFFGATLLIVLQCYTGQAKGVVGEHTLEVTNEGLLETTDYHTLLHRWSGFHKMKQSIGFLWIYVTDTGAHIVPLKRPLKEGDLLLFVDHVRSKVKNA